MNLLDVTVALKEPFIEAAIGYLMTEAVAVSKRIAEKIGLFPRQDLYSTWESCISIALKQIQKAGNPSLRDTNVKKLVADLESSLKDLDFTPLRVSGDFMPTWLEDAFFDALSVQKRVRHEISNKLLGCAIVIAENRLQNMINEKRELFQEVISIELKNVHEAISLITPAIPMSYDECDYIEHVFEPPDCFDNIIDMIREKNLAVLAGPPHVGKSFVARRILLEYAHNGYEAMVVSPTCDRLFLAKLLRKFDRCILLVDDFYGKYKLERTPSSFVESLGELLQITDRQHKLLLTTRLNILEQAHRTGLSEGIPIGEFTVEIAAADYQQSSRLSILRKLVNYQNTSKTTRMNTAELEECIVDTLRFPHNISWLVERHLTGESKSKSEILDAIKRSNLIENEVSIFYDTRKTTEKLALGILSLLEASDFCVEFDEINSMMSILDQQTLTKQPGCHKLHLILNRLADSRIIKSDPSAFARSGRYSFYHPSYLEAILSSFISDCLMVPVLECLLTEVSHRKQSDRLKALLYRPWHEREFDKSLPQILSYIERNLDESRWDLVDLLIKLSKNPKATLDLKLPCIRILLRNSNKNPDLFSEWLQEILENADVNAKIAVIRSIFENQHWSVHFSVFLQRLLEDHDDRVVMMIAFSVYLLLHININAKRIFGTELSMMWDEVESLTRKIDCDPHELWDFLKRYRSFLMNDLSADNLLAIKLDAISLCAARESLHPLKDELKRLAQLPRNAPKMLETEEIAITAENLEALRGTIRGLFCSQNEDARQIAAFSLCSCYENFPMLRQLVDSLWLELSCDPEMKVKETVLYCIQKELENVPPGLRGRFCELCKTCSRVYIV